MFHTGYFSKIQKYEECGLVPIGIAARLPEGLRNIHHMPELGPSWSIFSEYQKTHDTEVYTRRFTEEILGKLNPDQIMTNILLFVKGTNKLPILLCYENPNAFCHRHIVAKWLNTHFDFNGTEFII